MTQRQAVKGGLDLINHSVFAMLGTIDKKGCPNIRAVLKMENKGLKKIWFSTNTSSTKVAEIQNNPKACVYLVDFKKWAGLTLTGAVKILRDRKSKKRVWRKGFEKYYPLGINDPDYSVLCFTARKGKYYSNLSSAAFMIRACNGII